MISGSGAPASPTACFCQVSVATPIRHGDRGSVIYLPCQFGVRFSAKAFGPSLASSVWKIVDDSALSLR